MENATSLNPNRSVQNRIAPAPDPGPQVREHFVGGAWRISAPVAAGKHDGEVMQGFRTAVLARLRGPGGYYNLGNAIGLLSGLTFQFIEAAGTASGGQVIGTYLFGSPGATALSLSMLLFFAGGEFYHRAYAGRSIAGPDPRLTRLADLVSGFGALLLAIALAIFGDVFLALTSTLFLAGGKFGNALTPAGAWPATIGGRSVDLFRMAALVSRVPAVTGLVIQVLQQRAGDASSLGALTEPLILLACFGLWIRADIMLART